MLSVFSSNGVIGMDFSIRVKNHMLSWEQQPSKSFFEGSANDRSVCRLKFVVLIS
jgi:hypothetical protein